MGIFQHKQDPKKTASDDLLTEEEHFFDEYFREELRNHGRWYFEKVINENGELFKRDLEQTIASVNAELKEHVAKQLDEAIEQVNANLQTQASKQFEVQFAEFSASLAEAQTQALNTMTEGARELKEQHDQLRATLQKNVTDQQSLLHSTFEENKAHIAAMKEAQDAALKWLNQSAQQLSDQYQAISTTLQQNVANQQRIIMDGFQDNMAVIVEHYLLDALGEQYDLKAQLPAIIKQMEANKQAIVEDMTL